MTRWEYSSNFIFVVRSSLPPRRLLDSRLRRNVRGGPVQRAQRGLSRRRGGTERKGGFPAIVNRPFTTVVFDFVLLHLLSPCLSGSVRGLAFDRSSAAGGRGPEIGSPRSSRRARRGAEVHRNGCISALVLHYFCAERAHVGTFVSLVWSCPGKRSVRHLRRGGRNARVRPRGPCCDEPISRGFHPVKPGGERSKVERRWVSRQVAGPVGASPTET